MDDVIFNRILTVLLLLQCGDRRHKKISIFHTARGLLCCFL
jgi:hypothetical protein